MNVKNLSLAAVLTLTTACDISYGDYGCYDPSGTYGEMCEGQSQIDGALEVIIHPTLEVAYATVTLTTDDEVSDTITVYPDYYGELVVSSPGAPPEGDAEVTAVLTLTNGDTLPLFCDDLQLSTQEAYNNGYPVKTDTRSRSGQCYLWIDLDNVIE